MSVDNTVSEISKLRVAALYGKKRHYNASERKRRTHLCLTYAVLLLNIITGSVLFGVIKAHVWEHLPALMALSSALLIGTSEFFKFGKHSSEHQNIGDRYLGLARECSSIIALQRDGQVDDEHLRQKSGELQKRLHEIDVSAGAYPTNKKDYEKSRQGVRNGEETYTPEELQG